MHEAQQFIALTGIKFRTCVVKHVIGQIDLAPPTVHDEDRHAVEGERSRLVEADYLYGAQGLHCAQMAHQHIVSPHVADAQRQSSRSHGRQTFGDGRDGQGN